MVLVSDASRRTASSLCVIENGSLRPMRAKQKRATGQDMSEKPPKKEITDLSVHRAVMTCMVFILCMFCLSYGTNVLSAEDFSKSPRINNTDQQCRTLVWATLELPDIEKQGNIQELIECLEHEYFYTLHRGASKYTLLQIGEPALPGLIEALKNRNYRIAEGAAIVLGMVGQEAKEAAPALKDLLRSKSAPQGLRKYEVARALGKIDEIDFLIRALRGEEPGVSASNASHGISAAGPKAVKAIPALLEMINGDKAPEQSFAADALGAIGEASNEAIPRLKVLTKSKYNFVRRAAGEALLKIGTPEAIEAAKPYKLRKDIYGGFFKAMSVFVWNPWLAMVVGVIIGGIAYLTTKEFTKKTKMMRSLYLPAVLWLIYAAWEFYARMQGANIRIDLLVIYPLLVTVTIIGFVLWFIGVQRGKSTSQIVE